MKEHTYSFDFVTSLYKSVGLRSRNMNYFSKWVYKIYRDFFYLPGIDIGYIDQLAKDKTKLSVFAILVDDLADNVKLRNKYLLEKALQIPWNGSEIDDIKYLEITKKIWSDVYNSIENYPRFNEFEEIFNFDLDHFLNSIKYSYLINTSNLGNSTENAMYSHHNMMIMIFLNMDLMCSPFFKKKELSKFRPLAYWIQDICHIGNVISTYIREIEEMDFSSPIISLGLTEGLITKTDVRKNPDKTLKKLNSLLIKFKTRAEKDFDKIKDNSKNVESIDIDEFYSRLRKVYSCFLERPRYWELEKVEIEDRQTIMQSITKITPYNTWVRM